MAAILRSAMLDSYTAILDSNTLLPSLRFTQKHSQSILTLTQTNSIWLKLIYSHLTWWWQSSWICPSWIQPYKFILSNSLTLAKISSQHLHKKTSLIHSDSTWWLQLSWNLPSSIQPFCTKRTLLIHSDSTWWWQPSWIFPSWIQPFCTNLWLKLVQSDSNSFILTQLDDGSHLDLCHHGFSHFAQKKLYSFILTQLDDGSHLEFFHLGFSHFVQISDSN